MIKRIRHIYNIEKLIFIFIFSMCGSNPKTIERISKHELKTMSNLQLSPLVDSLFDIYIKDAPKANAYAICIDKKSEGLSDYVITIAPFSKKIISFYESGAANYFLLNDSIPVFIYSGMEDFLVCDSPKFMEAKRLPPEATGEFRNIDYYKMFVDFTRGFSYVHFDTSSFIVEENTLPFMNLRLGRTIVYFDTTLLEKKQ